MPCWNESPLTVRQRRFVPAAVVWGGAASVSVYHRVKGDAGVGVNAAVKGADDAKDAEGTAAIG